MATSTIKRLIPYVDYSTKLVNQHATTSSYTYTASVDSAVFARKNYYVVDSAHEIIIKSASDTELFRGELISANVCYFIEAGEKATITGDSSYASFMTVFPVKGVNLLRAMSHRWRHKCECDKETNRLKTWYIRVASNTHNNDAGRNLPVHNHFRCTHDFVPDLGRWFGFHSNRDFCDSKHEQLCSDRRCWLTVGAFCDCLFLSSIPERGCA